MCADCLFLSLGMEFDLCCPAKTFEASSREGTVSSLLAFDGAS